MKWFQSIFTFTLIISVLLGSASACLAEESLPFDGSSRIEREVNEDIVRLQNELAQASDEDLIYLYDVYWDRRAGVCLTTPLVTVGMTAYSAVGSVLVASLNKLGEWGVVKELPSDLLPTPLQIFINGSTAAPKKCWGEIIAVRLIKEEMLYRGLL